MLNKAKAIIKASIEGTLKELDYGQNLFADPTVKQLFTQRGTTKFPPPDQYQEFLHGDPESPNTEEEMAVLTDIVNFTRENYNDIEDFKNNAQELLALKSKFPKMLDPKQGKNTGKLVYRGATIPISVLQKLASKINPAIGEKGLYTIENPGIKVTPSSGRGIHSFSASLIQALDFMDVTAGKHNRPKFRIPVVFAIDSSEPNLLLNPDFLDALSIFNEQEAMLIGDSFTPKEIYIDREALEWRLSDEEKKELDKILPSRRSVDEERISLNKQLISEIGEGNSQPFEYTREDGDSYTIYGETSKGDEITISLIAVTGGEWLIKTSTGGDSLFAAELEGQTGMYISFKIISINGESPENRYREVNDLKYMFRLMATLKEILIPIIQKKDVSFLSYSPTLKISNYKNDEGGGRDILYSLFIKKEFPNAELHGKTDNRVTILNR